jgi:hypothetical protein
MVRLKEAQKNIMPSGTTFCHSSMAGSGRWSMFSDGTCRQETQPGGGSASGSSLLVNCCMHVCGLWVSLRSSAVVLAVPNMLLAVLT